MLWHICGNVLIKPPKKWLIMMYILIYYLCCCDTMSCNFSQTCKEKQFRYQKDENIVNKNGFTISGKYLFSALLQKGLFIE